MSVLELVKAGGWLMVPIIALSVVALAIILERLWVLRRARIMPENLVGSIRNLHRQGQLTPKRLGELREGSPLGRILVAGVVNRHHSPEVMKEAIEAAGRQVIAALERYLDTLGTIAAVEPLLGLLGTVLGMIQIFGEIVNAGIGQGARLAGGISVALITTAAGLMVSIPALMFHRYFVSKVNSLAVGMEEQAFKLVEVIQGLRESDEE